MTVSILAAVLVLAQLVTFIAGDSTLEIAVGVVLLLVLLTYALARVQDFRDDDGNLTGRVILGNFWALIRLVLQRREVETDETVDPTERRVRQILWISCGLLTIRSLLVVIGSGWRGVSGQTTPDLDFVINFLLLAWAPAIYAGYPVISGWWRRSIGAGDEATTAPSEPVANADAAKHDISRLPPAIDLVRGSPSAFTAADAIIDPVLKKLVEALPSWSPRRSRYEVEYPH